MTLNSPQLVDLLRKAYSAEKAAIRQIELDEWNHRKEAAMSANTSG
jgi:hypothetical protein